MTLEVGLRGAVRLDVSPADTAVAARSGDVEVLATPRVVAMCEEAARAAIAAALERGVTTVGVRIEIDHLAATRVGRQVVAEAELTAVDGRRLEFLVQAREGDTVIARGRHWRQVVDRERFLARLR